MAYIFTVKLLIDAANKSEGYGVINQILGGSQEAYYNTDEGPGLIDYAFTEAVVKTIDELDEFIGNGTYEEGDFQIF